MKINRNLFIVFVTIFIFAHISYSRESTCIKIESYKIGYKDAIHDISNGNCTYTLLGLNMKFLRKFDLISNKALKYSVEIRMQDEFADVKAFCYKTGYNKAVRDKLREKYGFDVIQGIIEE
jgi:hypothetical protein